MAQDEYFVTRLKTKEEFQTDGPVRIKIGEVSNGKVKLVFSECNGVRSKVFKVGEATIIPLDELLNPKKSLTRRE